MKTQLIENEGSQSLIMCHIKRQTHRSFCIETIDGDEVWLPKSQIKIESETHSIESHVAELSVPNWLVEQLDII